MPSRKRAKGAAALVEKAANRSRRHEPYRIIPRIPSNPDFEAVKSLRSNLPHAVAVRRCADLSESYRRFRSEAPVMVELNAVIDVLTAKKIPFVLTGAHGMAGWTGRVRSTQDVDVLVKAGRNHARAVKALHDHYPQLEIRRFTGLTDFFIPGEIYSVIDVAFPQRPDNEETLRTAIWIAERGRRYRIPTLECFLANKYGAMLALGRDPIKRGQDGVDFSSMVRHSTDPGRQPLDLARLAELGELVWPGGGGPEILGLVEQVKSGRVATVNPLEERSPPP